MRLLIALLLVISLGLGSNFIRNYSIEYFSKQKHLQFISCIRDLYIYKIDAANKQRYILVCMESKNHNYLLFKTGCKDVFEGDLDCYD